MEVRMTVTRNESAKAITITLSGSVMIDETVKLFLAMMDALESTYPRINLNLSSITEVDESFFKMLLSLRRMLAQQNKTLCLTAMSDDHCVITTASTLGLNLNALIIKEETS